MKMRRRILSLFLCFIMCLPMMPSAAIAAITPYEVWVNGEQFNSEKLTIQCGSGTATLDVTKGPYMLTLDNAEITKGGDSDSASIKSNESLNINVVGTNKVTSDTDTGIDVNGNLAILGTGELIVNGGFCGIDVSNDLYLSGSCDVSVHADYTGISTYRNVTISGDGDISATSNNDNAIYANGHIWLNGFGNHISFTNINSNDFAVKSGYPVGGSRLGDYDITGNPDSIHVEYTLKKPNTPITSVSVTGIKTPVYGKPCSVSDIVIATNPENATSTEACFWVKQDDDLGTWNFEGKYWSKVPEGATFEVGDYILIAEIAAADGYRFKYTADYHVFVDAKISGESTIPDTDEAGQCIVNSSVYTVEEPTVYDLWVSGVQVTSVNAGDVLGDGKVKYAADESTLTILEGANITGVYERALIYAEGMDLIINAPDSLTMEFTDYYGVRIKGEGNNLTVNGNVNLTCFDSNARALYAEKGSITVNGDLEVHSGAGTGEIGYSAVDAQKDVTVTGNVNISGMLYGLYAHNRNVKVYGNAELQTKWYGLYAYNNIAVDKDVKVTVSGNWVAVTANKGSVTIGGNVTSKYTGTEVNTNYGVHAGKNIEIKGDVDIEGFKEGIKAGDDITIGGSAVIKAVEYGLNAGAYGKITMVSGTWDIAITSTDPYNATVWCSTVVIPDTHTITTPEGGIAQYGTIYDADGTTFAKHVVIAPKGHDETEVKDAKEATCTEDGYTGDTYCKDCGEKLEDGEIIPAKGHTYGEWVVTKEPTTTETGLKERTCSVCGDKDTEVIPVLTAKIPVTSLDVTVNGYVPGGNPADTEVICSTEGVVVKSFRWTKYSYENWITITDPFETNVDYTIEIFFDVEDGYDVSGLTKDTVTMCGNPLYYYFNNPWSEPSNGAMRIFYNMGEVKYDYAMISGDGSVWTKGSTEGLVFVSEAPFDKFKGYIWIDEYSIDEENLIAESGSTKITIPASILQLDDFAIGEHTVIIVSTDGQASAKFNIKAADSTDDPAGPTDDPAGPSDEPMAPQTGDNTNVLVLLLLAILSLCVFVFVSYKRKEN